MDGSEERAWRYDVRTVFMAIAVAAAWVLGGILAGRLMPQGMRYGLLLGLFGANVSAAAIAIVLAPRRCLQVGLPAVLLGNGCGLAGIWFFSRMMEPWQLLTALACLLGLGYAPGLLVLWGGWRLHLRYGRSGSVPLALGVVVLAHGTLFGLTVPERLEAARLAPLKAEAARWVSGEVVVGGGDFTWHRRYEPLPKGCPAELSGSTGGAWVRLQGVPSGRRLAGLSDLDLGKDGVSMEIGFGGVTEKLGLANTRDFWGKEAKSVADFTPSQLAEQRLIRWELARAFREVEKRPEKASVWEAQREGLTLRYQYQPPAGFSGSRIEIEVLGRYTKAGAPSGLQRRERGRGPGPTGCETMRHVPACGACLPRGEGGRPEARVVSS